MVYTLDIVQSISDRENLLTTNFCASFGLQSDIANSLYIPPSATSANFGLCRLDENPYQVR